MLGPLTKTRALFAAKQLQRVMCDVVADVVRGWGDAEPSACRLFGQSRRIAPASESVMPLKMTDLCPSSSRV